MFQIDQLFENQMHIQNFETVTKLLQFCTQTWSIDVLSQDMELLEVSIEGTLLETEALVLLSGSLSLNPLLSAQPCSFPFTYI